MSLRRSSAVALALALGATACTTSSNNNSTSIVSGDAGAVAVGDGGPGSPRPDGGPASGSPDGGSADGGASAGGPAGTLDPSFGDGGIVTTALLPSNGWFVTDSDGSIVTCMGDTVWRLTPSGAVDSSFAPDKLPQGAYCAGMGRRPDGAYLVAAEHVDTPSGDNVYTSRALDHTGALVASYATSGVATIPFGVSDCSLFARYAADGALALACVRAQGAQPIARLAPDGSLVGSFGNGGVLPDGIDYEKAGVAAIDSKQRVVILSVGYSPRVLRLDPTGAMDGTFGAYGGEVLVGQQRVPAADLPPDAALAVLPDDSILAAWADSGEAAVVRVDAKGNIDTSYGVAGTARLGRSDVGTVDDVVPLPDGSAILVGALTVGNPTQANGATANYRWLVAKVTKAGQVDASFGAGGLASLPGGNAGMAASGALDAQGRLVLYGRYASGANDETILARMFP